MPQMPSGSKLYTWYEDHRAEKTARFYRVQLRQLTKWTKENRVGFTQFGKRDMDRYLAERSKTVGRNTLSHDGVAAKAFFKWCARYDLLERSPLAEYEVRRPPRPPKYMPTEEDLSTLLKALIRYWDPDENPAIRNVHAAKRLFHRTRNYAIVTFLVDSACRIGEALTSGGGVGSSSCRWSISPPGARSRFTRWVSRGASPWSHRCRASTRSG